MGKVKPWRVRASSRRLVAGACFSIPRWPRPTEWTMKGEMSRSTFAIVLEGAHA